MGNKKKKSKKNKRKIFSWGRLLSTIIRLLLLAAALSALPIILRYLFQDAIEIIQKPEKYRFFILGLCLYVIIKTFFFRSMVMLETFVHEMTHALAALLSLKKVSEFRVMLPAGSYVKVQKTNCFIALAPYWLPLATVPFLLLSEIVHRSYQHIIMGMIGLTLCFHLYQVRHSFSLHQLDIKQTGKLFSVIIIVFLLIFSMDIVLITVTEGLGDVTDRLIHFGKDVHTMYKPFLRDLERSLHV